MHTLRKHNTTLSKPVSIEWEFKSRDGFYQLKDIIDNRYPELKLETEHGHNHYELNLRHYLPLNQSIEFWTDFVNQVDWHTRLDEQCGMHVHIDMVDKTPIQIANLITSFYEFQNVIQLGIPRTRWESNVNCKEVRRENAEHAYQYAKKWQRGEIDREDFIRHISGWKFYGLSTNQLNNFGTIEWRWFGTTKVASKLFQRVMLAVNLTEYWSRPTTKLFKVTSESPRMRVRKSGAVEKSKGNRYSKGEPKNLHWSWRQVFEYGSENLGQAKMWEADCIRLANHNIERVDLEGIVNEIKTRYGKAGA